MRAVLVLCGFLTICVVITAQKSKDACSGYFEQVATINRGYKPHWFQIYFKGCLQGHRILDIPVYTITLPSEYAHVNEISDLPLLKEVYVDNGHLSAIPEFINLPSMEKISLANNNLETIPSHVISRIPVKNLILSKNQIATIEKVAFGDNVESILLTCNNITTLSPTWFRNPTAVKELRIGGNKIKEIPENMFKDFINLVNLELRNNEIATLGAGSISGPSQMNLLHLGYNQISEIIPEVFGPIINITNFNVEYNRLSFFHKAMMDKVIAKNTLIWANPWQCPCQKIINNWILKNNKDFYLGLPRDEDPTCVTALSFRNACVPFVDDDLYETFRMTFEISPFSICTSI